MKLIYIKSTMEPKNYSTIRSILKKAQGEKIAPYVFKINDTQTLQEYLDQEKITYEIYQEERKIINKKQSNLLTKDRSSYCYGLDKRYSNTFIKLWFAFCSFDTIAIKSQTT